MRKRSDNKKLNDLLDRIVAGEKIMLSRDISEDTRQKILAAEKLLECTTGPSPDFQSQLKHRVMSKLDSELTMATLKTGRGRFSGWITDIIPAAPVWRTATIAFTVGIMALLVVWAAGLLPFSPVPSGNDPPMVGTSGPVPVTVEPVVTGTVSAKAGSLISVELLFRNTSTGTVAINSYPPEVWISRPLDRAPLRIFPAGTGDFPILPSGKIGYTLVWDQTDNDGKQVDPGVYMVSVMNICVTEDNNPQPQHFDAPSLTLIEILPR